MLALENREKNAGQAKTEDDHCSSDSLPLTFEVGVLSMRSQNCHLFFPFLSAQWVSYLFIPLADD